MNTENQTQTTTAEANPPQADANEEILTLLRKLVEQNTAKDPQTTKQSSNASKKPEHAPQETVGDSEVKRLLEELLKAKAAPADVEGNDEEDATGEDDEFVGEFFWNPAPEWEPVAYAAGGAALVGLGALLYHLLKD